MSTELKKSNGDATGRGGAPEDIMHPDGRALFAYWDTLRGNARAPHRNEVELRSVASILVWIGVVESHAPGRHRWRLAGTGIARIWGRGLTGSSVAADWPELPRRALWRAFDGVTVRQQPFVARLQATSARGEALGLEFIALPVEANGGSTQALCAVLPFNSPRWLGKVPLVDIEVRALRTLPAAPLPGEIALSGPRPNGPGRLRLIAGGRTDAAK